MLHMYNMYGVLGALYVFHMCYTGVYPIHVPHIDFCKCDILVLVLHV